MALWNTGRFDDIRGDASLAKKAGSYGSVVTERRIVRSIKYDGMKSITVSEILDRFKERKVGLSVESQIRPQPCSARQGHYCWNIWGNADASSPKWIRKFARCRLLRSKADRSIEVPGKGGRDHLSRE